MTPTLRPFRAALVCVAVVAGPAAAQEATWKAGVARAVVTPETGVWLAGYGGKRPPDGKLHDLWAKALALEAPGGDRAVLVTSDFQGVPKEMTDRVFARLKTKYGLERRQVMMTFSHNHCGPRLGLDLVDYYPVEAEQVKLVDEYTTKMEGVLVALVGDALKALAPATLATGRGTAAFAVNRRNNREADVPALLAKGEPLKGPVDHAVPVLTATGKDGKLLAVLFGYACHPTTLNFTKWCGDYPGFAQLAIEKAHPGATAMFVNTCGGDQNPLPRRSVALCEKYGHLLAAGIEEVLKKPLTPIKPGLRTAFATVDLPYEKVVTRAELEAEAKGPAGIKKRWADRLLKKLDAGEAFAAAYPYPLHAWKLGDDTLMIGLGAEAVVDYALRFKAEYGANTWVCGYADDMISYIPSRRVWDEGGYEGGPNLYEYGRPALRWAGDIEDRVAGAVDKLVKSVQVAVAPTYPDHTDLTYTLDAAGTKAPIRTPADWAVRRTHVLADMARVMGPLPDPTRRVPLDVKEVGRVKVGTLVRRKVTYQADPNDRVPAYVFTPADPPAQKLPAILALQQTTPLGKDEPAGLGHKDMAYGLELAQRGYVVVVPDYPSFGEHKYDFAAGRGYASGSMKAVWDNVRAVDLLATLPEVDADRIGVIGHSLGGHNALFTALFEPRLKVVVSSCGFSSMRKDDVPSWNGPRYMPRIASEFGNDARRLPFDFHEVVAGLAPRPFLAVAAEKDDDFDVGGVRDVMAAAEGVYRLHGAADRLAAHYPKAGHSFPPDARRAAYEFLDKHLKK